jgi:uncharacterized protein (DUF1684 family)
VTRFLFSFVFACTMLTTALALAQPCEHAISAWQYRYKLEFLHDPRSPLRASDTGDLRFYPPRCSYEFTAKLKRTPGAKPVQMPTHSGKVKTFRLYGKVQVWSHKGVLDFRPRFLIIDKHTLTLYQSVDRPEDTLLFLPFFDETNGVETYGGGRYLDISKSTFDEKGWGTIDFNRAYNPWCAYKEGYNCPIPPKENRMKTKVEAGEMLYGGAHKE